MDRTSHHETGRSRRLSTGVTLVAVATVALVSMVALHSTSWAAPAAPGRAHDLLFPNASGVLGIVTATGIDTENPFFDDLGSNGRSCVTCHQPAQAWTITPAELQERFDRTEGLDPIFRVNDGSNCEGADVSTVEKRRRAFSLLLAKGLIRVALEVPAGAEFEIAAVDDPYRCGAALSSASMYRRPLPSANLKFVSAVMWDGRLSPPGRAIRDGLLKQALDAVTGHAQGAPPSPAQLESIVDFQLGLFAAQAVDRSAGLLAQGITRGGTGTLAREAFCIGINDPLDMLPPMPGACMTKSAGLDPFVFTLFRAWTNAGSAQQQAIARGEAIFNTRPFVIDNVPGLNASPDDPVRRPLLTGTCTVCHDTPNAGNHSVPMALNIGVADASRRTPDMPLYTLRHKATGDIVKTTDPGRAMVTGRWNDIGKFKGPVLRALAARPPYFHDGSAATLADVITFYDTRFQARFTEQEKADLLAFLQAL
jgi:cytochrome c peroxidase